ncbi:ABC transporter substrate-binding protein [Sulfurospirillum deleyianum]|uniref:diguanylate cyclase n=1 Tax=Sulfurospirillum deleyianum (strain ATCC 51133 / DSM 6946 / 5175) TaxID=525898 RepID=D1B416_SULD5|nr:ABC transporter substrate-binding protein [Sulfurospirillum deleyianum]ACZ12836.1 diguanylate cyclase [Sulfurospirillum deleyianum DSM 6946]
MRVLLWISILTIALFANTSKETISLQLSWLHQFQFAGFYVAKEKGFYEEANLDVTLKEYASNIHPTQEVLEGRSTYGVVNGSSLLLDRNAQKPVVALMALFQSDPSVLVSTNPAIKSPKDLKYKYLLMSDEDFRSVGILAMFLSHGIKREELFLKNHSLNLETLINQQVDAMACYISNEPFILKEKNISYTVLSPRDHGFNFYGDVLFTSEKELLLHPKRAKAFYDATKKGWEWAFEHIDETAQLIYENYNTQKKSLEALTYEGKTLKELAFDEEGLFGTLKPSKFEEIGNIYRVGGIMKNGLSLKGFIDPLFFAKTEVRIGVLNSRDESNSLSKSWDENAQYLSSLFPLHHFVVIPLDFKTLEERVKNHTIEFVITNPLQGLQLEHRYGLGRIATLSSPYKGNYYSELGTVIFTRADAKQIQSYEDARSKKIGAVSEHSFGGYLLGIKELGIASNKNITFFQTHFNVIKAVLNGSVDVGIVRTDIIEQMVHEGFIKQSDLKVLGAKTHPNFPFISSTDLYPGWMLAKMPNTPETLSNELLSTLLKPPSASSSSKPLYRVNTTLDYSKIHHILKEFHLFPYEQEAITFEDVYAKYKFLLLGLGIAFILSLLFSLYIQLLNRKLQHYSHEVQRFNETLEQEVNERTHELSLLNAKLKDLANIDELTKIANRRYFFLLATQYFHAAKRNNTPLHILSIDIDWLKKVNDTYGHAMGDEVLKAFCKHVQSSLRQSDLFGRIGGEEFCVCIQNTPLQGAKILAEKIRHKVEASRESINNQALPAITVSIGLSSLHPEDEEIFDTLKRSDEALYKAKHHGRNQVQIV